MHPKTLNHKTIMRYVIFYCCDPFIIPPAVRYVCDGRAIRDRNLDNHMYICMLRCLNADD
jgi:hypothetical protein